MNRAEHNYLLVCKNNKNPISVQILRRIPSTMYVVGLLLGVEVTFEYPILPEEHFPKITQVYIKTISKDRVHVTYKFEEVMNGFRADYYRHVRDAYPIGSLHSGRIASDGFNKEFKCVINGHISSRICNLAEYMLENKTIQIGTSVVAEVMSLALDNRSEECRMICKIET